MARQSYYFGHFGALCLAALFMLGAGCGGSMVLTPKQQALRELRSGRYDAAIAICGEAARLNPQDAEVYLYRARAYHYRGGKNDLERALADFSEAIRLAPQEAEAYYGRALAYRDSGNVEQSAADEKMARQLDAHLGDINAIYAQLPDPSPPMPSSRPSTEEPSVSKESSPGGKSDEKESDLSEFDQLQQYRRLKERFESTDPAAGYRGGLSRADADPQAEFLPLLTNPPFKLSKAPETPLPSNEDPEFDAEFPPHPQGGNFPQKRAAERRQGDASDLPREFLKEPISPWQRREPSIVDPKLSRRMRNPFPQRAPRPTGFVEEPEQPPRTYSNDSIYNNNSYLPPPIGLP